MNKAGSRQAVSAVVNPNLAYVITNNNLNIHPCNQGDMSHPITAFELQDATDYTMPTSSKC